MRRFALALAVLGAAAGGCGGGGVPGEALNDPVTERLIMNPLPAPAPWQKVGDRHTRTDSLSVWVPPGQDLKGARDLLTLRVETGRPKIAATEFAAELVEAAAKDCPGARIGKPKPATEDGNDVAYAEASCTSPQQSLVLVKVIRGHEALYAVERELRGAPDAAAVRAADAYLAKDVYLCPVSGGIGRCANLPPRDLFE